KRFSIRRATVDDIHVLLHHRRSMYEDMGRQDTEALDRIAPSARTYFDTAIPDGSYQGFLAVNAEGEVVGGAGVVISRWPGDYYERTPRRAMILNMYVERNYRRRGIARALMEAMIEWCRDNGFARVSLHASDDGRQLYEKLGFTPTNEMKLSLR
ncbi:MAG TPA: GNAT family N-acetyltransferase, partial [Gemmatimonadaceae bacterium]|nr:GNAT family N-acetyltransferase [Gemmatimonadaceae bacterium]